MGAWIGVDLDGTLAHYDRWGAGIGKPIPRMVDLVKALLAAGNEVRIFTARASLPEIFKEQEALIQAWCEEHIGVKLPVTHMKDLEMLHYYDDRAISVEPNTGKLCVCFGRQ